MRHIGPRLAALLALAVVVVGVGLALGPAWRARAPEPAAPAAPELERATDAAVDEALRLAPVDSAAIKSRWLDEVRGIAYDDLDAGRRALFVRFANAQRCTCGCGWTVAGCLASDMTCDVSRPMAMALLDSLRAGLRPDTTGVRRRPPGPPA